MAVSDENAAWPPSSGLSTPTVSVGDAIFTTAASIKIEAPANLVFSYVSDTSTYPSWCSFAPRVTINSQPEGTPPDSKKLVVGTAFTYHVVMDSSRPSKTTTTHLIVTDVSTPDQQSSYLNLETLSTNASYTEDLTKLYRISWKGHGGLFAATGLRTERFHEIIITGQNSCEVRTWEVMAGMVARTVKWMYKNTLDKKFQDWVEDLKRISEEKTNGNRSD